MNAKLPRLRGVGIFFPIRSFLFFFLNEHQTAGLIFVCIVRDRMRLYRVAARLPR